MPPSFRLMTMVVSRGMVLPSVGAGKFVNVGSPLPGCWVELCAQVPVGNAEPRLELGASLGQGALDYRRILASLFGEGYDGPLVLEFTSDDASKPLHERIAEDIALVRKVLSEL